MLVKPPKKCLFQGVLANINTISYNLKMVLHERVFHFVYLSCSDNFKNVKNSAYVS